MRIPWTGPALALFALAFTIPSAALATPASEGKPAPPAVLTGRVLLPDGPVASVRVRLERFDATRPPSAFPKEQSEPELLGEATTDEHGRFAITDSGWSPGFATLRLEGPGIATATWADAHIATGTRALPTDLDVLAMPAVSLTGIVLDEHGRPATGARVGLTAHSLHAVAVASAISGSGGSFRFDSLPAHAAVVIVAEGGDSAKGAVGRSGAWLSDSGVTRAAVHLEPTVRMAGQIFRMSGGRRVPVPRAPIEVAIGASGSTGALPTIGWGVRDSSRTHHLTDDEGKYDLTMPRGATASLAMPGLERKDLRGGAHLASALPATSVHVKDAAGRPLAGALIAGYSPAPYRVVTGADGSGHFPGTRWAQEIVVTAPGLIGSRLQRLSGGRVVVHVAPADGRDAGRGVLSGIVREPSSPDGEPGAAVADALVVVRPPSDDPIVTATDASGRFAVGGLPQASIEVTARRGRDVASASLRPGRSGELTLGAGASLRVKVMDASRAVAGAVVVASPLSAADLPRRARTASAGEAILDGLVTGDWVAGGILTGGALAVSAPVALTSGGEARLAEASSSRVGRMVVTVTDEGGAPLEGALVVADGPRFGTVIRRRPGAPRGDVLPRLVPSTRVGAPSAATGADGRATLEGLPSDRCRAWTVLRPGHVAPVPDCVSAPAGGTLERHAAMKLAAGLRVTVLDALEQPVSGATVTVFPDASLAERPVDAQSQLVRPNSGFVTDISGLSVITDLAPGRHQVRACRAGSLPAEDAVVTVTSGAIESVTMRLRAGGNVEGVVVDASGLPASGAMVTIQGDRLSPSSSACPPEIVVGDDGRFVIAGLDPTQRVTLVAQREGDVSPPKRVMPGEEPVTLSLVARGRIEGVVLRDGEPVPNAGVECTASQGRSPSMRQSMDDGSFEFEGLEPGTYACRAWSTLHGSGRVEEIFVDAAPVRVSIPLADRRALRVSVRDARTGAPIPRAVVGSSSKSVETDEAGACTLELDPWLASASVMTRAEGYAQATRDAPPPPADSMEVVLAALPLIRGRVLASDGSPAEGATVSGADVDASGDFKLKVTAPGPKRLFATRTRGNVRQEATRLVDVPAEGLEGIVLTLEDLPTGTLRVTVVDGEAPVVGARVNVVAEAMGSGATQWSESGIRPVGGDARWTQASGATDSAGTFTADALPPGEYAVQLGRKDAQRLVRAGSVTVTGEEIAEVTLSLPRERRIRGSVTRGGAPVEAAPIWMQISSPGSFMSSQSIAARTDPDGTFETEPIAEGLGPIRLSARPPDPALPDDRRDVPAVVPPGAEDSWLTFDLLGVSLPGVVTVSGAPAKDATITAKLVLDPGQLVADGNLNAWSAQARADAAGAFVLRGLPPGEDLEVVAMLAPHDPAAARVTLPMAGSAETLALDLTDTGGIAGRAMTPSGPLVDTLRFALVRDDGVRLTVPSVATRTDGGFVLPVNALASYAYRATARGWAPVLGRIAPGEPLEMRLTAGARVEVTVRDEAGEPVEGATALLRALDGVVPDEHVVRSSLESSLGRTMASDAAGRLVLSQIVPGRLLIELRRGDERAEVEVAVGDGETARTSVVLRRAEGAGE